MYSSVMTPKFAEVNHSLNIVIKIVYVKLCFIKMLLKKILESFNHEIKICILLA